MGGRLFILNTALAPEDSHTGDLRSDLLGPLPGSHREAWSRRDTACDRRSSAVRLGVGSEVPRASVEAKSPPKGHERCTRCPVSPPSQAGGPRSQRLPPRSPSLSCYHPWRGGGPQGQCVQGTLPVGPMQPRLGRGGTPSPTWSPGSASCLFPFPQASLTFDLLISQPLLWAHLGAAPANEFSGQQGLQALLPG